MKIAPAPVEFDLCFSPPLVVSKQHEDELLTTDYADVTDFKARRAGIFVANRNKKIPSSVQERHRRCGEVDRSGLAARISAFRI